MTQKNKQNHRQIFVTLTSAALVAGSLLACSHAAEKPNPPPAADSSTKASSPNVTGSSAQTPTQNPDPQLIDATIDPCQDYFHYACGTWLKNVEIPSDRASWARGFGVLDEHNQILLRETLERYAAGQMQPANPYAKPLGDFYASCMDTAKLEDGSMKTLNAELKRLDAVTQKDLPALIAHFRLSGVRVLFGINQTQDNKDPEKVIGEIDQGGYGLPTREYYHGDKPQMVEIRAKYVKFVARLFEQSGEAPAQAASDADAVLRFETRLTDKAKMPAELRDPKVTYHPTTIGALGKLAPGLEWPTIFKALNLGTMKIVNVSEPEYLQGVDELLKSTPLAEMKTYLKFSLLNELAEGLPDRFYDTTFDFYAKTLSGVKQKPERWKICENSVSESMAFALGRSYVAQAFAGESKTIAKKLIESIEKTESREIDQLAWMDAKTKKQAHEKLKNLVNDVGYPDKWRSYDGLNIDRGSYLSNLLASAEFNTHYSLDKIGKPLNRKDWGMRPSAVNAYYDPQKDKMVFPAGILQPPFFHAGYSAAANYGGIGMVMGHEISHGFDDQGRQFDAQGRQRDWWSPASASEFEKRASCLEKQYDSFTIADGSHVNGKLTLGEDIGDQGGITLSFASWKTTLPADVQNDPAKLREASKSFFLSFAQTWCTKNTDAYEKLMVNTNPHPPARFRVNGPLSNLPAFSEAYQCKEGTPLAPVNRCIVW